MDGPGLIVCKAEVDIIRVKVLPIFYLTIFVVTTLSSSSLAGAKPRKPNRFHYQNNRLFELSNNRRGSQRVTVKVYGVFDEGASFLPVRLYPYMKCGSGPLRPVDLVRPLYFSSRKLYSRFAGSPHKHFPRGVLRVCALQNVRMDNQRLFVSIHLEKGPASCDDVQVMDLIYNLSELCD